MQITYANLDAPTLGLRQRNRALISTVPFDRDRKFVGRQAILTALESQFSRADSHNRVVLARLGGVGYALTYYRYFWADKLHSKSQSKRRRDASTSNRSNREGA
jgi:hypothetical protein